MAFRGIFIGIDRYDSPRIPWLSCAVRDATAMYSLFLDNLGGNPILLTDNNATHENIKEALNDLKNSKKDDVVVIYFSGHGSETYELVTYDAVTSDLQKTAIPLDSLLELFKSIPSKRLICILKQVKICDFNCTLCVCGHAAFPCAGFADHR